MVRNVPSQRYIPDTARPTVKSTVMNSSRFRPAVLCLLLFAAFVPMDKNKSEVMHVDSSRIVDEITTDLDVVEVWKEL